MRNILFIIVLIISQVLFSQEKKLGDGQSIEIRKTKIEKGNIKSSSDEKIKVLIVKFLITSSNKEPVDINAFSLLDIENKIRYRLIRYQSHKGKSIAGFKHSNDSYLKTEILNDNGKPYKLLPKYDPTIKDSFDNYNMEGFINCEMPLDFGLNIKYSASELFSEKRHLKSVVYFPECKWDIFNGQFQFPVNMKRKKPILELYYKKKMISKINY